MITSVPWSARYGLFSKQLRYQDRFRFGQEANGDPAKPCGWDNLD